MLSSDKNVESIVELIGALKEHVELQKEYLELNVIEKVVKLVTASLWPSSSSFSVWPYSSTSPTPLSTG
jgi:hypothetical protein